RVPAGAAPRARRGPLRRHVERCDRVGIAASGARARAGPSSRNDLARLGRAVSHDNTVRTGFGLAMSIEQSTEATPTIADSPSSGGATGVSHTSWRSALESRIPSPVAEEIDLFENQIELRRQGKLEEKVFAELRLRRGAYGQRYDNGKRHDGVATQ